MYYKNKKSGEIVKINHNVNPLLWEIYNGGDAAQIVKQESLRLEAKIVRDTALNAMTHTLADGAEVQTRPSDLTNFQISIDLGVSKDWVLVNNTVRTLTVAEMGECLTSGIAQADVIWTAYTDFLKAN